MLAIWSDQHRLHRPNGEVWVGVRIPGTEVPERGEAIRQALAEAGVEMLAPQPYPDEALETVHDPAFVDFLRTAWTEWERSGYLEDPGQDRVVPYAFALPRLTGGRQPRQPASAGARAGLYAMDTMTLIGPGTWEAARAAAWCAISAADMASSSGAVYAACRPPGHHAARDVYGGSCYLNNAALAAERLRLNGYERVAVLDLDAHHGNGTQEIFYRRDDVFYGSLHVDPGEGWFPHFLGYDEESGEGAGEGHNLNLPLPPGTGDGPWLEALDTLIGRMARVDALVISLGVDCIAGDPESPLRVTAGGLQRAGERLGELGLPTTIVQEGGYHLPTLGSLVVAFLEGFEEAR